LTFSQWESIGLFDLMLQFGGLIALPYTVPLIWGVIIKRAPAWAGWTTVLVGFITSLAGKQFLTPEWIQHVMGWTAPLTIREQSDWVLLLSVLLNALVCSIWFLASCYFAKHRSTKERERVEEFFQRMQTPVDFNREIGPANDALQYRTLGRLCLIYGSFVLLLVLIPNSLGGRFSMFFCSGALLGVGALLIWNYRRLQSKPAQPGDCLAAARDSSS
jgi:hypothetical protein